MLCETFTSFPITMHKCFLLFITNIDTRSLSAKEKYVHANTTCTPLPYYSAFQ